MARLIFSVATRSAARNSRRLFHAPPEPAAREVCNSLSRTQTFESLAQEFKSIKFTTSQINNVLISLKDTSNATKALKFFHFSAKVSNFNHGVSTYSITIHILAKARLIRDAKALIESALGKSDVFTVLDSLVESYKATDSLPLVFDLFVQVCSKLRLIDSALGVCEFLGKNGFFLSVVSYNSLLHVLQKSENHEMVWGVYGHMIRNRVRPNQSTVKIMISALCKEGKLQQFVDVVERIQGRRCEPGVVVNTCLIHRMIEHGEIEDGLLLLKRMLQKNMILDEISYSLVVFAKVKMGDLDHAWKVFDEMLKRGFEGNAFVYNVFITAYCNEGKVDSAIDLVKKIETLNLKPCSDTFNSLINCCSKAQRLKESLNFCEKMTQTGLVPSCSAFNAMAEKLCENGRAKEADEMLSLLLDKGFVPDENTYSHLLAGYTKEGDIDGALKLYYEMEYRSISPNSLALTRLIIGLCKHGRTNEADKYLGLMKAQCSVPSLDVYKLLISSHLESGNPTRANQLYGEIVCFETRHDFLIE